MSGVRCTNSKKSLFSVLAMIIVFSVLTGCGSVKPDMKYDPDYSVSSFKMVNLNYAEVADTFASSLCTTSSNYSENTDVDMSMALAAGLYNITTKETIFEKNSNTSLSCASLTKIMTALTAIKYGQLDMELTVSNAINLLDPDSSTCGLKVGDKLTLDQALHALLIGSANDAAVVIAEGVGGTEEAFIEMMNEEAQRIGATNSHFMNPHGLTEGDHYTSVYDLYIILNEAIKSEKFVEIISMSNYSTQYTDKKDKAVQMNINTTNWYLSNKTTAPDRITVIGGKTGTTISAGQCLAIYAKDIYGNAYIGVILGSSERKVVYDEMSDMLNEIYN